MLFDFQQWYTAGHRCSLVDAVAAVRPHNRAAVHLSMPLDLVPDVAIALTWLDWTQPWRGDGQEEERTAGTGVCM